MERCIVNAKGVRAQKVLAAAQKCSARYYGDSIFEKRGSEPRCRIQKLVRIDKPCFVDLVGKAGPAPEGRETCGQQPFFSGEDKGRQLIDACRLGKLTGGSGNGYPVAEKLESFLLQKEDKGSPEKGILLINGIECDPGLVQDAWIYRNQLDRVEEGIRMLEDAFGFSRILLATKEPLRKMGGRTEQIRVKNRFPMGYERYLIRSVLKTELPEGMPPVAAGILVMNLQTVLSIAALKRGEGADCLLLTVADLSEGTATVVRVKKGASVEEIIEKVYPGRRFAANQICVGSGAFCCHKKTEGECVTDTVRFIGIGQMPDYRTAKKCVGCGRCTKNCPAGVDVRKIIALTEKGQAADAGQLRRCHPERCISCGACTFGCAAGKDTREMIAGVNDRYYNGDKKETEETAKWQ